MQRGFWVWLERPVGNSDLARSLLCSGKQVYDPLSGSATKAALLREHGAEVVVDYRKTPQWSGAVLEATGERGADIIVETVGTTLDQSLAAVSFGGFIGVVGFLGGFEVPLNVRHLIGPMVRLQGIVVGSRATLESVIRLMELHRIRPLVDSVFPLDKTADAFRRLEGAQHAGKIVIDVAG